MLDKVVVLGSKCPFLLIEILVLNLLLLIYLKKVFWNDDCCLVNSLSVFSFDESVEILSLVSANTNPESSFDSRDWNGWL